MRDKCLSRGNMAWYFWPNFRLVNCIHVELTPNMVTIFLNRVIDVSKVCLKYPPEGSEVIFTEMPFRSLLEN